MALVSHYFCEPTDSRSESQLFAGRRWSPFVPIFDQISRVEGRSRVANDHTKQIDKSQRLRGLTDARWMCHDSGGWITVK